MNKLLFFYITIINITGLLLMYIDKKRAIKNMWRIKERTLFFVSIVGGSIGSLIGMNLFRHKTKHISFTLGIPIILLIQLALVFIVFII